MKTHQVSFDATVEEMDLIRLIAKRFEESPFWTGPSYGAGLKNRRMQTIMDLTAANANGCPMDFAALLASDDTTFVHDIAGIARHIDRTTGKLLDCFLPRTAKKEGR